MSAPKSTADLPECIEALKAKNDMLNQSGPPVAPTGVPVAPPPVGAARQELMPSASELERGLDLL